MILEGTGKGLLDSLIAEGGVKNRDLSGMVIEIRTPLSFSPLPYTWSH